MDRFPDDSPRMHAKRGQIRQAAQALFLQRGFERTTMDAIVEAAHVSKQTLYRYYQSKEDLFADILQQLTHQRTWQVVSTEQPFGSRDALERTLIALAQALVSSLMHPTYLAFLRVVLAEMPHIPQIAPLFRSTVAQQGMADLLTLFQGAHEAGLITLSHPELAVRLFVGPLLTYVLTDGLFASEEEPRLPTPERITEIVQLFFQVIS